TCPCAGNQLPSSRSAIVAPCAPGAGSLSRSCNYSTQGWSMSIQQLLQQVLQSGQGLVQDATSGVKQNNGPASKLGGFGGGALAGGALGLLLGNKKMRKMGGKFATYGAAAALGALALKTYQDWQQQSSQDAAVPAAGQPAGA